MPGTGAGGRIGSGKDLGAIGVHGRTILLEVTQFIRTSRDVRECEVAQYGLYRSKLAGLRKNLLCDIGNGLVRFR